MAGTLVSVVIPTWNRVDALVRAVQSVAAQTHRELEIIVVDDGSQDGTRQVMADLMRLEPRLLYIYQENAGVSAARNRGLDASHGDYVALLDSDDTWVPWKIELQLRCFSVEPSIGMVWTDMAAVDPQGHVIHARYLKKMYTAYRRFTEADLFQASVPLVELAGHLSQEVGDRRFFRGDIFSQMVTGNLVHTSTVLLSRERVQAVKYFNEDLKPSGEDFDFHLRTCREGMVGFLDLPAVHYQIGMADQLTHSSYRVHIARNFLKTIEPCILRDHERIHLPERVIVETLAHAHHWFGKELLLSGNPLEARDHLLQSWRAARGVPSACLYLLSFLPVKSVEVLRNSLRPVYRWLRNLRSPASDIR